MKKENKNTSISANDFKLLAGDTKEGTKFPGEPDLFNLECEGMCGL